MSFNSIVFLWLFLPVSIAMYYVVPSRIKNFVLVLFSLLFYAWGGANLKYVSILVMMVIVNYVGGRILEKVPKSKASKLVLLICILIDLAPLILFKYTDFILLRLNSMVGTQFSALNLLLPLGISFFTFQTLTYIVDVYNRNVKAQHNFIDLALYITFFPKLVMGPIVKYKDMEGQLRHHKTDATKFAYGIKRFIYGLAKKMIIADVLATGVDKIFAYDVGTLTTPTILLGVIMYSMQLYYDFSGYSDMAIGLAKMFGFDFKENFDYPYISQSIKEFWRRWHISLSSWFRDYIYIPLGGNRKGKIFTYRNLLIVFILTGIWHGATFNFWFWGLFHGFFIIIERMFLGKWLDNNRFKFINVAYTIIIVFIGWAMFRCANLTDAMYLVKNMFIPHPNAVLNVAFFMTNKLWFTLILSILFAGFLQVKVKKLHHVFYSDTLYPQEMLVQFLLFAYCILNAVTGTYSSFIYFKF